MPTRSGPRVRNRTRCSLEWEESHALACEDGTCPPPLLLTLNDPPLGDQRVSDDRCDLLTCEVRRVFITDVDDVPRGTRLAVRRKLTKRVVRIPDRQCTRVL